MIVLNGATLNEKVESLKFLGHWTILVFLFVLMCIMFKIFMNFYLLKFVFI